MKAIVLLACVLALGIGSPLAFGQEIVHVNTPDHPPIVRIHTLPGDAEHAAALNAKAKQVDQLKKQAEEQIAKGELSKAVSLLQQAIQEWPAGDYQEGRLLLAETYTRMGRKRDAILAFQLLIYPTNTVGSIAQDITTQMKYVLLVLSDGNWSEAAVVYNRSANRDLPYRISDGDKILTLSKVQFDPTSPDFSGLKARAHLILGAQEPIHETVSVESRLDHLKQALRYEPRLVEAHLISGKLLAQNGRFTAARTEYTRAAGQAPENLQPEIASALKRIKFQEDAQKNGKTSQTTQPGKLQKP